MKPARKKLTAKQEAFCVNYFLTHNGTQSAVKAGYSSNLNVAHVIAAENLQKPTIQARLSQLQEAAIPKEGLAKAAIAIVSERLEILTEVARHRIETPVSSGHKIAAVAEMNKMEHVYQVPPVSNQDNRVLNIIVIDGETKELINKVKERTQKLIEGGG